MTKRTRLNDREHRAGKDLARKQVFLVQDSGKEFVEIQFSAAYAPLYHKTLNAYRQVPPSYIGKLIDADDARLTLTVQYLGAQLDVSEASVTKIIGFIKELAKVTGGSSSDFTHWRYVDTLQEFIHDDRIVSLVENANARLNNFKTGCGIDDPVISNYTEDSGGVHLIDLDHFSSNHSVYYQIGFVMADYELQADKPLASTQKELNAKYSTHSPDANIDSQETLPLLIGYVSRLAIDIINYHKKLESHRSVESLDAIFELAGSIT